MGSAPQGLPRVPILLFMFTLVELPPYCNRTSSHPEHGVEDAGPHAHGSQRPRLAGDVKERAHEEQV